MPDGMGPSRAFLDQMGLGEGLLDLPTDELWLRKKRQNPDPVFTSHDVNPQGYSDTRSFSAGIGPSERLMPQVINGILTTPDDAVNWSMRTGRHLGTYDTPEHADYAGQRLHELQELHNMLLRVGRGH